MARFQRVIYGFGNEQKALSAREQYKQKPQLRQVKGSRLLALGLKIHYDLSGFEQN